MRAVDEKTASQLNLKPGQKLCPECYKRDSARSQHDTEISEMSDTDYQPGEISVASLNKTAESLDCTPIKTSVSKRDKSSYGKRKVKQLNTAVKSKCAHALDLTMSEFESTDDSDPETCKDLERLVALLKDKLKIATRQEKNQIIDHYTRKLDNTENNAGV